MKKLLNISVFSLILGLSTFFNASYAIANQADAITVSNPFAREVPPSAPASASFMTLNNSSNNNIKITAADSNAAKVVELHTHTNDNGVMRMRQIPFIEIPANGSTQLKPGGLHIMLISPYKPLKKGQTINVSLTFEDGSNKSIAMPVKSIMGMMKHKKGQTMSHQHSTM